MSDECLNLGEAMRRAREKANRERNRMKCKRYYRRKMDRIHPKQIRGISEGDG